jgi:outer membrane cobalamin receptor
MKKTYLIIICFAFITNAFSQTTTVKGTVTNHADGETVIGANILLDKTTGTVTDIDGNYSIEVPVGRTTLTFKYIGFTTEKKIFTTKENEVYILNLVMEEESRKLDAVVVSAGKFEQKISDVTVSMEIITPEMIENENNVTLEDAITKVPGVMILDKQASIRGGSGYSFGAGSRVLMLVDDLPMLTGASGEARWDFAPIENIKQVEVIKGASSALYGSSALNGAINVRTKYPTAKSETKITTYFGVYGNPRREEIKSWGKYNPIFSGTRFSHGQSIGNFDYIVGGNLSSDNKWRINDQEERYRFNINTRYRSKKHEGLSFGVNANYMKRKGELFLIWLNGDSVYYPSESFKQEYHNQSLGITPYITYFVNGKTRHSLKGRIYSIRNLNNTGQKNFDDLIYEEYQFQKFYDGGLTWTSGATSTQVISESEIYGKEYHNSISMGAYTQVDKKFSRLKISLGARWEAHKIDDEDFKSRPVFRSGLNYQLFDNTFIRTSFGQGFRYPTIAERYTRTNAGAINIFPNYNLNPESGWSAEIGFKQGFRLGGWNGYLDVAGFWTEYNEMIEFTFGYHNPQDTFNLIEDSEYYMGKWIGFKAFNISNARIYGIDATITAQGKILSVPVKLLAGYTYTNPLDMDIGDSIGYSSEEAMLKYRFYHNAKLDIEFSPRKYVIGMSIDYHSKIVNIDDAFQDTLTMPDGTTPLCIVGGPVTIFPGMKEYREEYDNGKLCFNFRVGYQLTDKIRTSVILKNAFNREYSGRPGDVRAPRNITFLLMIKV